jgi:hypothetical protein
MRTLIFWGILSFLCSACATQVPIQQHPTFQQLDKVEKDAREKLDILSKEYSQWQRKEREFLQQLDVAQTQAYTEYKKMNSAEMAKIMPHSRSIFMGGPASPPPDQATFILAKKQLHSVFAAYPNGESLYSTAMTIESKLSLLNSDMDYERYKIREMSKTKADLRRAYGK